MGILRQLAATAGKGWGHLDLPDRCRCVIVGVTVPVSIVLATVSASQSEMQGATRTSESGASYAARQQAQSFHDSVSRSFAGGPLTRAEMIIESATLESAAQLEPASHLVPQASVFLTLDTAGHAVPSATRVTR